MATKIFAQRYMENYERQNDALPEDAVRNVQHLLDKIDKMTLECQEDTSDNDIDVENHLTYEQLQLLESGIEKDYTQIETPQTQMPDKENCEKVWYIDSESQFRCAYCYETKFEEGSALAKIFNKRRNVNKVDISDDVEDISSQRIEQQTFGSECLTKLERTTQSSSKSQKKERGSLSRQPRNKAELLTNESNFKLKPKSASSQNNRTLEELSKEDKYFLNSVVLRYFSEIALLQRHLKSRNTCNSDDVIVAKIFINNNQPITEDVFEYVRKNLVGRIGAYQRKSMDMPKFHSITHDSSYITIVCDNDYAYNCLEECIENIAQKKTMGALRLSALPDTPPTIYCFDTIYDCVVREPDLFLTQLNLHKSKLGTNHWIVVAHNVKPQERKTYFTFLIDERSAHALTVYYGSSFYICLHKITFRCRGIVAE